MFSVSLLSSPVALLTEQLLHEVITDVAFGVQLPEYLLCYPGWRREREESKGERKRGIRGKGGRGKGGRGEGGGGGGREGINVGILSIRVPSSSLGLLRGCGPSKCIKLNIKPFVDLRVDGIVLGAYLMRESRKEGSERVAREREVGTIPLEE